MNELVSIIIPVYNRASLLPETLDSIVSQTYKNFECILVDDWSTDNSVEVANLYVERDSRFKLYKRPTTFKKGACSCRNYGFEKCTGAFIQWFDSDDLMLNNMIEDKVNALSSNVADLVIMRHATFIDDFKDYVVDQRESIKNSTDNPAFEIISADFTAFTSQVMFRKTFLNCQKQLFNNNLQKNQETEFFIRLFLSKPKLVFNENLGMLIRRDGHISLSSTFDKLSESKKMLINIIAYFEIYKSFKQANRLTSEIKKFFNNFFFKCLLRMEVDKKVYLNLFIIGVLNNWFPSFSLALKIFLKRYFLENIKNRKSIIV